MTDNLNKAAKEYTVIEIKYKGEPNHLIMYNNEWRWLDDEYIEDLPTLHENQIEHIEWQKQQSPLRWVKASELVPENYNELHWRWAETKKPIKEKIRIGDEYASIPFGFPMRGNRMVDKSEIEYLDESASIPQGKEESHTALKL